MTVKKVLCVDDNPVELMLIQGVLEEAGIEVITATGGVTGLARAWSDKPELIFLDIVMPDMDGFAVLRELQRFPATRNIPVVFVSSKSNAADKAWAGMQGGKGYITKPYAPAEVLEELKKF